MAIDRSDKRAGGGTLRRLLVGAAGHHSSSRIDWTGQWTGRVGDRPDYSPVAGRHQRAARQRCVPGRYSPRRDSHDARAASTGGPAWPLERPHTAKRVRVRVRAYAKVNLDLRVLGNRADGYHELRTVFQSVALHDTLLCVTRPGPLALRCRTSGVPLDESNLVWRAAAALWTAIGRPGAPSGDLDLDQETDSTAGGPRRRQRRRGGGAPGARAGLGWSAGIARA